MATQFNHYFHSFSAIPLMYPASFIFSVPSTAFVGLACINLFIGIVTTVTSFTLQLFDDPVTTDSKLISFLNFEKKKNMFLFIFNSI